MTTDCFGTSNKEPRLVGILNNTVIKTGEGSSITKEDIAKAINIHNKSEDAHSSLFEEKQDKIITLGEETILANEWTQEKGISGYYEYTFNNDIIKENHKVEIVPAINSVETILTAGILPIIYSSDGTITIYSESIPTDDIVVEIYLTEIN